MDPVYSRPDEKHQPEEVYCLRPVRGGFEVAPPTIGQVPFTEVVGLAAFQQGMRIDAPTCLLIFLEGRSRPLWVSLQRIDFSRIQGIEAKPTLEKFRTVGLLVAKHAGQLAVDRGTFGFLKGGDLPRLEREVIDLATAFSTQLASVGIPTPAAVPGPPTPRPGSAVSSPVGPATPSRLSPAAVQPTPPPRARAQSGPALPSPVRAAAHPGSKGQGIYAQKKTKRGRAVVAASAVVLGLALMALVFVIRPWASKPAKQPKLPPTLPYSIMEVPEISQLRQTHPDIHAGLEELSRGFWMRGTSSSSLTLKSYQKIGEYQFSSGYKRDWKVEMRRVDVAAVTQASDESLVIQMDFLREHKLSQKKLERYLRDLEPLRSPFSPDSIISEPPAPPVPVEVPMDPYRFICHIARFGKVGTCQVQRNGVVQSQMSWGKGPGQPGP